MPHWTKGPPQDPRGQGLPIVRTPATGYLRAIVTSPILIGCDTHYWGGHTVPCERPECEACNSGIAYRWHGYLTAYNPNDQLHFIFEMTAQAANPFNEYLQTNGTLRCAQFEAWRWKHTRNGRVLIKVEHSATPSSALPAAPDICRVMAIIWRLPTPNVQVDGIDRGTARVWPHSHGDGQSPDPRRYETPNP